MKPNIVRQTYLRSADRAERIKDVEVTPRLIVEDEQHHVVFDISEDIVVPVAYLKGFNDAIEQVIDADGPSVPRCHRMLEHTIKALLKEGEARFLDESGEPDIDHGEAPVGLKHVRKQEFAVDVVDKRQN